jgi:uncharacterized membrane protein
MRKTLTLAFAAFLAVPLGAVALTLGASPAGAAGPYSIANWGTIPNTTIPTTYTASFGSINANGDGAGEAYLGNGSGAFHAILYKNGALTDLGSFQPGDSSAAEGINDSDTVVGAAAPNNESAGTPPGSYPVEWSSSGKLQILNTDHFGNAFAINDSGNAVGDYTDANGDAQSAEEWVNNTANTVNLPGLANAPTPPRAAAGAINNAGTIVGAALNSANEEVAVTFAAGAPAQPLPFPAGATDSYANSVSQLNGYIAGGADLPNGNSEAVQFGPGATAVVLPFLSGDNTCSAVGVNSSDVAIGDCYAAGSTAQTAVVWQNGAVTDLNTLIPANSGWVLSTASGINDNGQIAGYGLDNGHLNSFTLTPTVGAGPIPNPISGLGLVVGTLLGGVVALVATILASLANPMHFSIK